MEKENSIIIPQNISQNLPKNSSLFKLLMQYYWGNKLKRVYRQGWLDHGIGKDACESVADHSFGLCYLAMLFINEIKPSLNSLKLMQMAIIHDLGESFIGDITPREKKIFSEKNQKEEAFFANVFPFPNQLFDPKELFFEFIHQNTPEAQYIKFIDKLEMILQAYQYKDNDNSLNLSDFLESCPKLKEFNLLQFSPEIKKMIDVLMNKEFLL